MMKNEEEKDQGGFVVHVYSPGNQIIKTQYNNYYGPVYNNKGGSAEMNGFSDDQVAKALAACVGKGRVIDAKWKWAGAYWYLRWACNYPGETKKFCERIQGLPFQEALEFPCDYRNIREYITLSFMNEDPRRMDQVKYSQNDVSVFLVCKEIVQTIAVELGKTYLPKS